MIIIAMTDNDSTAIIKQMRHLWRALKGWLKEQNVWTNLIWKLMRH